MSRHIGSSVNSKSHEEKDSLKHDIFAMTPKLNSETLKPSIGGRNVLVTVSWGPNVPIRISGHDYNYHTID